jgi:hypothetical protein
VHRVKDGRFDGAFQLTVGNERGDRVNVTGSLAKAKNPCDQ